jgi:hypothetical protein
LGHIVRVGNYWLAFDATHFNEAGTAFRFLGSCVNISSAKYVVEWVVEEAQPLGNAN